MIVHGIEYSKPEVVLLQETGLGVAEIAARTCYDSFENSENDCIKEFTPDNYLKNIDLVNNIEHSELLDDLSWTYFHHSILEHINLSFLVKGTSRAVLQEHARHRIQAISVRSTRYTMSTLINAFVASQCDEEPRMFFIKILKQLDMFVTADPSYQSIEIDGMYSKLHYQRNVLGVDEFNKTAVAKSSLDFVTNISDSQTLFNTLEAGKKKRNVGDYTKHIITDNVKVDMVVTFNLRSLKNYFTLRASGAAWFQINWLAEEMIKVTPKKYIELILKPDKIEKILTK
jgi:thymidylate synthase (FAD)